MGKDFDDGLGVKGSFVKENRGGKGKIGQKKFMGSRLWIWG